MAGPVIELGTSGSGVRRATDCASRPGGQDLSLFATSQNFLTHKCVCVGGEGGGRGRGGGSGGDIDISIFFKFLGRYRICPIY